MRVLMFGWEFPPHISGGLGTACFGLTRGLLAENVEILFVVPKAYGDEEMPLINASDVWIQSKVEEANVQEEVTSATSVVGESSMITIEVNSPLVPYVSAEQESKQLEMWNWEYRTVQLSTETHIESRDEKRFNFSGTYGGNLFEEVKRYAEVARSVALKYDFDVIHAHDWLTYLAGIEAKTISGKPLVVHVHATEYDRAGEKNIDPRVYDIELKGMTAADRIIAVSQWTKEIVVDRYRINEQKVEVVHNGVIAENRPDFAFIPRLSDKVVTFLGRITYQKGPFYFIEAAKRVLEHFPEAHFIMAGSGDLLPEMIERVAQLRLSSRIHFTGFVRPWQVEQIWSVTNVYVMPSVSEPFGITPLEAIQSGVPVIVSNQSGVSEVIEHAIKVDFWDVTALANAIINVLKHPGLSHALRTNSKKEVELLTWKRTAEKINKLYYELINEF